MRTTSRSIALALLLALAVLPGARRRGEEEGRRRGQSGQSRQGRRRRREQRPRGQAAARPAQGAAREGGGGHRRAPRGDRPARELPARQPAFQGAGRGAVQAGRALLGRVEGRLHREDGEVPGRGRGVPHDRANCPNVPRKTPTVDLSQAQAVYLRLINNYPKFRKIDTVIYLYAFSLRDQGKVGESIKYFQTILDKYPRSRYIADAWMAIAEYRFYEQQNYKSSLEAYEKVLQHPKSQLYDLALFKTAWCYWKLGDTNKSALRFKDVLDLGQEEGGADRGAAEARRRAAGPGARLPGRAVHRGRHQERARRVRVPGADRRQAVLAQGAQAARRHRVRSDALRARRRGLPAADRAGSEQRRGARLPRQDRRVVPAAGRRQQRGRRDAQAGRRPTARAARGPPPTRIARRPSSTRARWPRASSATSRRPFTRRRSRTRRPPRWSTRSVTRAPPRRTSSTWPTSPTPRTPSSCATCAPTSSTSSWASTRRPDANTWRWARRSRWASSTRTRCCRRWARSRRSASRASARSARATACSARPPTFTRRCSRRTRRS